MAELHTERLRLRRWLPDDREPFAALNRDPAVVEFLPGPMSRADSDAMVERIEAHFDRHDFGVWAVEVTSVASFIGYVGLAIPRFEAAFTPCVEIGWRLASAHWGRGYATEAARAALEYGFDQVGLREIVSFTVPQNLPSRRVMTRIGMRHDRARDFDHPAFAPGHRLRRHVLYCITAAAGSGG